MNSWKLSHKSLCIRARLYRLRENSTWQIAVEGEASKLAANQPRSGGSAVSPGRKPRVKWEILASRVIGDTVLTHTL